MQNGNKHVIAFYSATMPDAASRYSSSELELCGLKKSLLHFQYLLKYSTFTVRMDHSALKRIYCSKKPAKMVHIQTSLKEISDFSFDFELSQVNICLFLISCLIFHQTIKMTNQFHTSQILLYLPTSHICHTWTTCVILIMIHYRGSVLNAFPVTISQAKLQKIAIPPLFKSSSTENVPTQKPSLLRDPPAVLALKRSTALPPVDLGTTATKKLGRGRPPNIRVVQPTPAIPVVERDVAEDINETLRTLFPVRKHLQRRQAIPEAQPVIVQPDALLPFIEEQTVIKQIDTRNLQDNIDLTRQTAPAGHN